MRYVLDTDMLTLYEEGHPKVVARVAVHSPEDLATTIISADEPARRVLSEHRGTGPTATPVLGEHPTTPLRLTRLTDPGYIDINN